MVLISYEHGRFVAALPVCPLVRTDLVVLTHLHAYINIINKTHFYRCMWGVEKPIGNSRVSHVTKDVRCIVVPQPSCQVQLFRSAPYAGTGGSRC